MTIVTLPCGYWIGRILWRDDRYTESDLAWFRRPLASVPK